MKESLSAAAGKLETNDYVATPSGQSGYFSAEECNKIMLLSEQLPLLDGSVSLNKEACTDDAIRKSAVKSMPPEPETQWVFDKINAAIIEVNKTYNYDLHGYAGVQIARYSERGHYAWHMDLGPGTMSNRKLSITVQLSDPNDYDGGELEFMGLADDKKQPENDQGAVIIFPSFLIHRVTPVTRGTRWSMVTWISGPAFR